MLTSNEYNKRKRSLGRRTPQESDKIAPRELREPRLRFPIHRSSERSLRHSVAGSRQRSDSWDSKRWRPSLICFGFGLALVPHATASRIAGSSGIDRTELKQFCLMRTDGISMNHSRRLIILLVAVACIGTWIYHDVTVAQERAIPVPGTQWEYKIMFPT